MAEQILELLCSLYPWHLVALLSQYSVVQYSFTRVPGSHHMLHDLISRPSALWRLPSPSPIPLLDRNNHREAPGALSYFFSLFIFLLVPFLLPTPRRSGHCPFRSRPHLLGLFLSFLVHNARKGYPGSRPRSLSCRQESGEYLIALAAS